ncbi:MAG: glycosyltransferase [Acholeplasmataceae bacterium]
MTTEGLRASRRFAPEMALISKPKQVPASRFAQLRPAKLVLWYGDVRDSLPPEVVPYAEITDLLLLTNTGHLPLYHRAGFRVAAFWPLASPPCFAPLPSPPSGRAVDVAFLGNSWPGHTNADDRLNILRQVSQKFQLRLYGKGWKGFRQEEIMGPAIMQDAARALAGAKLTIGMQHYRYVALAQSNRTWTHMSCGKCHLNWYVPDLERLFKHRVHQVFWDDAEELERELRYYLDRPAERLRIGAQARAYILEAHTFDHRVETMHKYLKGQRENTPWEMVLT